MLLCGFVAATQEPAKRVDFATEILPVFKAHCSPCHTNDTPSANLGLTTFEGVVRSVKAGDSEHSVLLDRILGKGGLPRMPMGFKPLSNADTELIRRWIDQGARRSSGGPAKRHWAFVPPVRPKMPATANSTWVKNAIDAFVLAKLEARKLHPSPRADKVTLLRRVTLDLIGLPPTPSEVDAFVADASPRAYEKVVDRLMASPHYGERMAWPWIELARYADSNGFQQDGDTFQYVWRDWVVKALNANMPFDQFTIEQLAGDLLPNATVDQLVATAFNRNHMLNGEGGAIPEEQRNVNLFDRVDTTATAWLGLTMTCTRCHDHKYDPLTQRDYFSMMAFFNNVPETGVPAGSGQYRIADPWIYAGNPAQMGELKALQRSETQAKEAVSNYVKSAEFQEGLSRRIEGLRADLEEAARAKVEFSPWSEVGVFVGEFFDKAVDTRFGPEDRLPEVGRPHPEWVDGAVYRLDGDRTAFYLLRRIRSDRAAPYLFSIGSDDAVKAWFNGQEVLSRKVTRGAVADSELVRVVLQPGENTFLLKIVNGAGIGGFYFKPYVGGVKDEVAALLRSGAGADEKKLRVLLEETSDSPRLLELRAAVTRVRPSLIELTSTLPRVMVMSDAMPRETKILNRGNYTEPLETVPPGTPASLPALDKPTKNRLDLAKWFVSSRNPLTARFQVNRAWQLFFGRGLVRTEENFGVKGEPPTHPELLDWLAVEFRESGWNVKRLHKLIVMSSTYQQSSKVSAAMLKVDPANELYGRASRFRLPSPILRDVALRASGLLVPKLGGKPVYPYQPKGIWDGLAITLERDFTYPQSIGADNHRRSLYTFWRRTVAPGNMFDTSTRQVCTVKPSLTSSPLHALTMLNDVTWVEAGRALAERVLALPSKTRLAEAFRRVCARRPKVDELAILERSLARSLAAFRADPAAAKQFVGLGDSRPGSLTPEETVQLASYSSVCLAILNLDEAMTRE